MPTKNGALTVFRCVFACIALVVALDGCSSGNPSEAPSTPGADLPDIISGNWAVVTQRSDGTAVNFNMSLQRGDRQRPGTIYNVEGTVTGIGNTDVQTLGVIDGNEFGLTVYYGAEPLTLIGQISSNTMAGDIGFLNIDGDDGSYSTFTASRF